MKAKSKERKEEASFDPLLILWGGLGLGLSFPPLPLPALAWFALAPLLLLWDRAASPGRMLAQVYTAFLLAYSVAFFWPILHTFAQSPLLSFGSLMLTPLALTLPFAASLPLRRARGRLAGFAALAAFYLAVESVLSQGDPAFPFPLLGHTQGAMTAFIQFVEFTGVAGLSLWVLLLNGLVFAVLTAKRRNRRAMRVLALVGFLAVSYGFGQWRSNQLDRAAQYVTVGLVQPAMETDVWTARRGAQRVQRLLAQSDSLIQSMNAPSVFMLWPEMALPASNSEDRRARTMDRVQAWVDSREAAVLTGALVRKGNRLTNGVVLLRPHDEPQRYEQIRFLPLQPGVALDEQAPWLDAPPRPHLTPGGDQRPLVFDGLRIGVLLGFEIVLGEYARQYPRRQANFLVTLTREGWWSSTPLFRQHLHYHRLRAIETRRSVVQVAATDGTAVIAPDGSVVYQAGKDEATARLAAVPLYDGVTFYVRFGNWLGRAALVLSAVLSLWLLVAGLRLLFQKRPAPPIPAASA